MVSKIERIIFFIVIIFSLSVFSINGENMKSIKVQGSGITQEKALVNAFKNAIKQVVGTFVDSETVVKNRKLIKDNVLMYSDGYIKNYKEIDSEKDDGFWTVTINATVALTELKKKITALGIGSVKVDNKGLFAEGLTKIDRQKDGNALFLKAFDGFPEKAFELSVTKPNIIKTDANGKVIIEYRINVKLKEEFVENLERVFKILEVKNPVKGKKYAEFVLYDILYLPIQPYDSYINGRVRGREVFLKNLKDLEIFQRGNQYFSFKPKNVTIPLDIRIGRYFRKQDSIQVLRNYKFDPEVVKGYKNKLQNNFIIKSDYISLEGKKIGSIAMSMYKYFFMLVDSNKSYKPFTNKFFKYFNFYFTMRHKMDISKIKKIKEIKVYFKINPTKADFIELRLNKKLYIELYGL